MEFDENGKPIFPPWIVEEKAKEPKSLIFTKTLIHKNKPAIAQLKITVGENIENPKKVLEKIKTFCDDFIATRYPSVDARIIVNDQKLIVESKESWMMYSFFKELIEELDLEIKGYGIVINGSWGDGDFDLNLRKDKK